MESDKGSPIFLLPILGLLLCAGAAALAGIALGADDDETPDTPTVVALGERCQPAPGPRPTTAADVPGWLSEVRACIQAELADVPGYDGTAVEGFARDVVVVRWTGEAPEVVVKRVAVIAGDSATVVGTRTAVVTAD